MQSDYSNPLVSNTNPFIQASPLSGFKFSTIGNSPSLLERMSDGPRASFRPPPSGQNSSQVQNSPSASSHTPSRPSLPQVLTVGAPLVERGLSVKPILTQDPNYRAPAPPTSSSPSEPRNDVKLSQPLDQIRPSVFPDLQYPNPTPDIENPLRESSYTPLKPVPMGQDISHHSQPPIRRSLPSGSVSDPPSVKSGAAAKPTGSSAVSLPSQHSGGTTSTEPEPVRRPVENLFKTASDREEGLAKRRQVLDVRSGELSTLGAEASQAVQDLLNKTETLKHQATEMRTQAEQTLQEATKMRDMADHLIQSADTLGVDLLGAKSQVGRAAERSQQVARFVQKSFDWLATLRNREQEQVAAVQAELEAQDLADLRRRQEELQRQLERRKIEEKEKMEAAKREEQEREAARKKAEEESEAARMRAYEIRRAEVMAEKRRASEAQAQSIQVERERRITDSPGSSRRPPARGSNTPLSTTPAPTPETAHSTRVSANSPVAVPTPPQSETTPSFPHPQPLPNKVKAAPASVSFVPAQTEAGRAVNTDSPLSSTTLASELHQGNVVGASRHPRFNQVIRDTQVMQSQNPRPVAPPSEPHQVEVKREPSVGELPPSHPQSPPDMEYSDQSQHRQPAAVLRTASQDRDAEQREPAFSTSGSRVTPSHVVQAEDNPRRAETPGSVSPQDERRHLQNSSYDRVAPSTDERVYGRRDSVSSDLSVQRWNYRDLRSPSPLSSRGGRSRSRSPPYWRKRTRSRSPPRFETRQIVDRWEPERPRIRPRIDDDWDRPRRYNGYDRGRQADSSRRFRALPRRGYNTYRPSRSPPPSPRQYRNERSPPRRSYHDRLLAAEHIPQRFVNTDVQERRTDEYRANVNARYHEPAYEEAEAYRTTEKEQQQRPQQYQQERRTPSPSERDQTSTPSPRQGEPEVGLLDRINMNEADDRGPGRGRAVAVARGGPSTRRGTRGVSSGGRGRAGAPALLSRMSETTTRPTRPAPALSLSDRMQQD